MGPPAITVQYLDRHPLASRSAEFVERKGIGHPDSMCDGIAEAISRRLSRYYLDEFGRVLHHNTDNVQLVAGTTAPEFGGGDVVDPMYVLIGGRATRTADGRPIPVDDIAIEAAREYVEESFAHLPPDAIEFESRIDETSTDLASLFDSGGVPLANDTSVGVGYAPPSETDRIVRGLETEIRRRVPAVGEDVKVMAWRSPDALRITIAAAVVSRYVSTVEDYVDVVDDVESVATEYASDRTDRRVSVTVNAADDVDSERIYLTVTGLSAEMGDDGSVGRGNRINGLITPHRPMSLEAAAGKNPVSHVGKLYNVVAAHIAERVHTELGADHAGVALLSQIGSPITDPLAVDVETTGGTEAEIRAIVSEELESVDALAPRFVAGELAPF